MKIGVLVPSEEYKHYAGARIRYGRLQPQLLLLGSELELIGIGDLNPADCTYDVLVFSKCHDARSLVLAEALSREGKLVGIDLFDDYFSQIADSRLARYRNWLREILPICRFALCSTPAMAGVVNAIKSDLPCHTVNDPAEGFNSAQHSQIVPAKVLKAQVEQRLQLAWFGVGDNPHFNVGLSDLAAYGGQLADLRRMGMDVELRVLTNPRALDSKGLSLLRQVPVRTVVEEWSEEREEAVLQESFASFLPVNFQPFSAAKSLNRAVTALSAGCQVISPGYPLYKRLDPFIYSSVAEFADDFGRREMRLSSGSLDALHLSIETLSSAEVESRALTQFLGSLDIGKRDTSPLVALVHGRETNGATHKMVHSIQGLSVASPFCATKLGYDVVFRNEGARMVMLISEKAVSRLTREHRDRLSRPRKGLDSKYLELSDEEHGKVASYDPITWRTPSISQQIATYDRTMNCIRSRLESAFGQCRVLVSENFSLPFSISG